MKRILCLIAAAVLFAKSDKAAGWLLAPYVIWLVFAGILNLVIALNA